ncbi:MAG: FAD:protein FMN transferase [Rhodospirillales bacterium]|nr:FAD:protein FMN transferase [Rhodospirillales bacterium]MDE0389647.1 FAD:protein FMN transferase [Rhodospirillales bacterium]
MTRWPAATPTRRRFLAIAAAAAGLPFAALRAGAETGHLHRWSGIALGAAAEIVFYHPDAARARRLIARCVAEIDRLEDVFSLYRPKSATSRLNRDGRLAAPPLELVTLLAEARSYSERTGGAFDITVQPLWRLYAEHFAKPGADPQGPGEAKHARARALVDYRAVEIEPAEVRFARPGMAITLNGIAQGYITDRVAALLQDAGMGDVLLDIGEVRALGHHPNGRPWHVGLRRASEPEAIVRTVTLSDRAVATSAGIASPFDAGGRHHHLFDPATGRPAPTARQISVIAPRATTADALSTALAVSSPAHAAAHAARFPEIEVLTDTVSRPS